MCFCLFRKNLHNVPLLWGTAGDKTTVSVFSFHTFKLLLSHNSSYLSPRFLSRSGYKGFPCWLWRVLATCYVCFSDVSAVTFWVAPFHHMPPCPQPLQLDPGEVPQPPQFSTVGMCAAVHGVQNVTVRLLESQWGCPKKKAVLFLGKGSFLAHHLQWGFMADFQHNTEFISNSVFLLPVRSVSLQ